MKTIKLNLAIYLIPIAVILFVAIAAIVLSHHSQVFLNSLK